MLPETKRCELCSDGASVYCPFDSAYLCHRCDSTVHSANFLVARHVRSALCCQFSNCRCENESEEKNESSLSSVCLSTTESSKDCFSEVSSKKRRMKKEEEVRDGILVNWCKRLGLDGDSAEVVVTTAAGVFQKLPRVNLRVALATSFWVGMRYFTTNQDPTCQTLVRLQKITGVPAKMILAVQRRVVKARRRVARQQTYEEGWAES